MPVLRPLDIVYKYDGSLAGFYGCVFTSFIGREMPLDIVTLSDPESLMISRFIDTNLERANRVRHGLAEKVSLRALDLTETAFYSCMKGREIALLRFLHEAFEVGPAIVERLSDPNISRILSAERHLLSECHLLCGFIRFVEVSGNLISTIGPKNFVLPFIAPHFEDRLANESFLIYDETHEAAMWHAPTSPCRIARMELPPTYLVSDAESRYQELWRKYYDTIGIASRTNPVCRMTHMPKRYWGYMTEMIGRL